MGWVVTDRVGRTMLRRDVEDAVRGRFLEIAASVANEGKTPWGAEVAFFNERPYADVYAAVMGHEFGGQWSALEVRGKWTPVFPLPDAELAGELERLVQVEVDRRLGDLPMRVSQEVAKLPHLRLERVPDGELAEVPPAKVPPAEVPPAEVPPAGDAAADPPLALEGQEPAGSRQRRRRPAADGE